MPRPRPSDLGSGAAAKAGEKIAGRQRQIDKAVDEAVRGSEVVTSEPKSSAQYAAEATKEAEDEAAAIEAEIRAKREARLRREQEELDVKYPRPSMITHFKRLLGN